jgi:hypothetical protein
MRIISVFAFGHGSTFECGFVFRDDSAAKGVFLFRHDSTFE